MFEITNASFGARTVPGRQHSSFEGSRTSRYVSLARFWTLYVPGLSLPSVKMDMGSRAGEVYMAGGNRVELVLACDSDNLICACATPRHTFLAWFREILDESTRAAA